MGDFEEWGAEISRRKNLNHPAAPVQSHLLQSGRMPSSGKTKVSASLCKLLYRLMATSAWMTCSSIFGSYGVMSTLAGLSNYRRRQKQNIQITSFEVKEKTRTHTKNPLVVSQAVSQARNADRLAASWLAQAALYFAHRISRLVYLKAYFVSHRCGAFPPGADREAAGSRRRADDNNGTLPETEQASSDELRAETTSGKKAIPHRIASQQ